MPRSTPLCNLVGQRQAEIWLYQPFGPSWADYISAKDVITSLASLGPVDEILVRINSPGGDILEASAIYTLLKDHPANVICQVDGMALSCAGWVLQAGDQRRAAENGTIMLHDPEGYLGFANSAAMRKEAEVLDKLKASIVDIFAARSGQPADIWSQAMTAETWYTSAEALDAKLLDEITPNKAIVNQFDGSRFANIPAHLKPLSQPVTNHKMPAIEGSWLPAWRQRAQTLNELEMNL